MKGINEIAAEFAQALLPVITALTGEEKYGAAVALASLTGNTAKLSGLYTEDSLRKMIIDAAIEGFNITP